MSEKKILSAKIDQRAQSQPVQQATAIPCNEANVHVLQGQAISTTATIATPVGGVNSGVTIARPQELNFEVVSVRLLNPVARTGQANLIGYGVDLNSQQVANNHRSAQDSSNREQQSINFGNLIGAQEATEEEAELRRGRIIAKQKAKEEHRNIKLGNRTTTASSVQDEKTTMHVQVPKNVTPGMLLSVDAPMSKKSNHTQRLTFAAPEGAQPGEVIEIMVGLQDADEAAVLAKMQRLRLEAEEKIRREAEQEEYSYKGLGGGEYEYNPTSGQHVQQEEYVYRG